MIQVASVAVGRASDKLRPDEDVVKKARLSSFARLRQRQLAVGAHHFKLPTCSQRPTLAAPAQQAVSVTGEQKRDFCDWTR